MSHKLYKVIIYILTIQFNIKIYNFTKKRVVL